MEPSRKAQHGPSDPPVLREASRGCNGTIDEGPRGAAPGGNGDPYGCPGELTQNTAVGTPVESVPGLFYTKPIKLKKLSTNTIVREYRNKGQKLTFLGQILIENHGVDKSATPRTTVRAVSYINECVALYRVVARGLHKVSR